MQRQEAGERQPGYAMHHRRDPQRVAAMAARMLVRGTRHGSTTAATALRPSAARISPKPHISASRLRPLSPAHSDADRTHADRPVRRRRQHEQRVERPPRDAAARAAQDLGRAQAAAGGIVDDDQMRQHQRRHDHRRRPLQDIEPHVHDAVPPAWLRLPLCRRRCLRHEEGGGRNATGLARPSRRSTHPPAGELSPMAFLGGGVCRGRGPSPPPDASSDLNRPSSALTGRRWPIQAADASPSPLIRIEGNAFDAGGGATRRNRAAARQQRWRLPCLPAITARRGCRPASSCA